MIAFVGNKIDLVQSTDGDATAGDDEAEEEASDSSEADDATATPAPGDSSDATAKSASAAATSTAAGGAAAGKRQVSKEEAQAYAQESGLLFAETSAKTGEGVVEVFTEIGNPFVPPYLSLLGGRKLI